MASRIGVIPFSLKGIPDYLVAAILGFEWGIGVRSGCFCAQPYVISLLGINRSGQNLNRYRMLHHRRDLIPGLVRISLGLYNTQQDIDTLIVALQAIARGEHGEYSVEKTTGMYLPVKEIENFSKHFKITDDSLPKAKKKISTVTIKQQKDRS
jgi:hypothetical protein